MNTENRNPFVPQGSLLDQKERGRTRVKIIFSIIAGINAIGLVALLILGCQKEKEPARQTTPEPPVQATTPSAEQVSNPPPADTNVTAPPVAPPAAPPVAPPVAPPALPPSAAGTQDYKIVAGDNYYTLSKKFHVSMTAIKDANPGVEPTKLQIGQTIHIPAPPASTAPALAPGATAPDTSGGGQIYKVKSGDNLTKIAGQFGTTVKALRAANSLKTDSLKVGQELKIPAKSTTPATGTPTGGTSGTATPPAGP